MQNLWNSVHFSESTNVFGHTESNPQSFEDMYSEGIEIFTRSSFWWNYFSTSKGKKGRLKNTVGRSCTHTYSSRRWALTALSLHLMMSLFTRWGEVLWGWVSLILSSPRWFRMWQHLSTYRENSPRMTIGTPRLTRLARTCLGRRLGPQYLKNYTLFYQEAMQLI